MLRVEGTAYRPHHPATNRAVRPSVAPGSRRFGGAAVRSAEWASAIGLCVAPAVMPLIVNTWKSHWRRAVAKVLPQPTAIGRSCHGAVAVLPTRVVPGVFKSEKLRALHTEEPLTVQKTDHVRSISAHRTLLAIGVCWIGLAVRVAAVG
jgi:hypothetical protein